MTRGTLLHDLYAAILREVRQRGERADPRRATVHRLRELGQAELAAHRALVPPPSEHVFERECERDPERPRPVPEARGRGARAARPSASRCRSAPATRGRAAGPGRARHDRARRRGCASSLRGRIDRIDRLADGSYEVVDYKTGGVFLRRGLAGTFAGGRQLQHALYALAATELLRATRPAGARDRRLLLLPHRRAARPSAWSVRRVSQATAGRGPARPLRSPGRRRLRPHRDETTTAASATSARACGPRRRRARPSGRSRTRRTRSSSRTGSSARMSERRAGAAVNGKSRCPTRRRAT